jgi:hypothetical protein
MIDTVFSVEMFIFLFSVFTVVFTLYLIREIQVYMNGRKKHKRSIFIYNEAFRCAGSIPIDKINIIGYKQSTLGIISPVVGRGEFSTSPVQFECVRCIVVDEFIFNTHHHLCQLCEQPPDPTFFSSLSRPEKEEFFRIFDSHILPLCTKLGQQKQILQLAIDEFGPGPH